MIYQLGRYVNVQLFVFLDLMCQNNGVLGLKYTTSFEKCPKILNVELLFF